MAKEAHNIIGPKQNDTIGRAAMERSHKRVICFCQLSCLSTSITNQGGRGKPPILPSFQRERETSWHVRDVRTSTRNGQIERQTVPSLAPRQTTDGSRVEVLLLKTATSTSDLVTDYYLHTTTSGDDNCDEEIDQFRKCT